jgi:RNA polymerase sigma-70 factor (ECF subfamily)
VRSVWTNIGVAMRTRAAERSFEALVLPHLGRLYQLAYRFTGSPEDAEDLVQALLVKMIPQEDKLRTLDKPGPWLARSLYHLYVDQVRHRTTSPLDLSADDSEAALQEQKLEDAARPDAQAEQLLTQEHIAAALAQLPDEQRAIVAWHDIEGYTLEELAEQHQIPLGTLKSRLHRARGRLRELLMKPFGASLRV